MENEQRNKSRFWPALFLILFVGASLVGAAYLGRNLAMHGSLWGPGAAGNRINILLVGVDDGDIANPKTSPHRSDSMLLMGVHKSMPSVSFRSPAIPGWRFPATVQPTNLVTLSPMVESS